MTTTPVRNVVLVHGGFVDGSGWQSVYDLLVEDGYQVSIVRTRPSRWRTKLAPDLLGRGLIASAAGGP